LQDTVGVICSAGRKIPILVAATPQVILLGQIGFDRGPLYDRLWVIHDYRRMHVRFAPEADIAR